MQKAKISQGWGGLLCLVILQSIFLSTSSLKPRSWLGENVVVDGSFPPGRMLATMTILNSRLYMFGGAGSKAPMLGDFFQYEFESKTWTDLTFGTSGSRPVALKLHGMVACAGMIWVLGGITVGEDESDSIPPRFWMYDPTLNAWSDLSDLEGVPQTQGFGFTCSREQHLFAFGGVFQERINGFWRFDIPAMTWTDMAQLAHGTPPGPREGVGLQALGSKLYTFGGNNQYVDWEAFAWVVERYDDMFEFNLENNTWTEITNEVQNRPERRFRFAMTASISPEKLYVLGGFNVKRLRDVQEFDPATMTWTDLADSLGTFLLPAGATPMGIGVEAPSVAVLGSSLLLFGGGGSDGYNNEFYRLDVAQKMWHHIGSSVHGAVPAAREYFGMATVGPVTYIFGGVAMAGGAEQYLNDVVAFDDIESVWSSLSPSGTPPVARAYCRMVGAASERKLWVFGGQSASTGDVLLNDLFVLDVTSNVWSNLSASATGTAPSPRANFAMGYISGSIFVFSGSIAPIEGFHKSGAPAPGPADLFEYNVSANAWSEITQLTSGPAPSTRWGMGSVVVDERLYICGGYGVGGYDSATMDVFAFEPANHSWTMLGQWGRDSDSAPIPRRDIGLAGRDGRLFTFGGWRWDSVLTSDVFEFDLASRTWTELTKAIAGTLPASRSGAGLAFARGSGSDSDRLLLFGGARGVTGRVPANDLHIVPLPRRLSWPSAMVAFAHVFDWDVFTDKAGQLRTHIQLCTGVYPCALTIKQSSMTVLEHGRVSCSASDGCQRIAIFASSFACARSLLAPHALVQADGAHVLLQASSFARCHALADGAVLQAFAGASVSIASSSFESLHSAGSGGAVSLVGARAGVEGSTFTNCSSELKGGALWAADFPRYPQAAQSAAVVVAGCTFERCRSNGWGGGVSANGQGEVEFRDSVFRNNAALGLGGGALHLNIRRSIVGKLEARDNAAEAGGGGALMLQGASRPELIQPVDWSRFDFASTTFNASRALNGARVPRGASPGSELSPLAVPVSAPCLPSATQCTQLTGASGFVSAAPYSNGQQQVWDIFPSDFVDSISVRFSLFNVEQDYDFVALYACTDPACASSQLLFLTSGAYGEFEFRVSSGRVLVALYADGYYTEEGIEFAYNTTAAGGEAPFCDLECLVCPPGSANKAGFGDCTASTYARLDVVDSVAVYPGGEFAVLVQKTDMLGQLITSDHASILEAVASSDGSFAPDFAIELTGSRAKALSGGQALFTLALKPQLQAVDAAALASASNEELALALTALARRPMLHFRGVDVVTGETMVSGLVHVNISRGRDVCPRGSVLQLGEPVASDHGGVARGGECVVCEPGSYSLDPLAGEERGRPACMACPAGGDCTGGGAEVVLQVGRWEEAEGRVWLKQCPRGHRMENASYVAQACQPCAAGSFIMRSDDPAFVCQTCPPGLKCLNQGPPVPGDAVVSHTVLLELDSLALPLGAASSSALQHALAAALLASPSLGLHLDPLAQVEVGLPAPASLLPSARRAAAAAPSASSQVVLHVSIFSASSPADSIRAALAASSFAPALQLQLAAAGQPVAGVAVQLATGAADVVAAVGRFETRGGALVLVSCPPGYLLVNSSLNAQRCARCEALTYSLNPSDGCLDGYCPPRPCTACPVGARCLGTPAASVFNLSRIFEPLINGSVWSLQPAPAGGVHLKRLVACPPGFILIREERFPSADQCLQCPAGKYAILEAAFNETLWTARAESMLELCHECDADANCTGGASVVPKAGFWELPRAEAHEEGSSLDASKVYIYECAAGGCVEGGGCAATREGPVCALCVPGFAMSGGACTRCGELGKGWARWMLLALLLAVVLVLWWYVALANLFKFREGRGERPVAATLLGSRKMREALKMVVRVAQDTTDRVLLFLADTNITDYIKIFISFWQIAGTFEATYKIQWPGGLKKIWSVGSVFRINVGEMPGLNCLMASASYGQKLAISTVVPCVVVLMLAAPALYLRLRRERHSVRAKAVVDRFWYTLMFWFFLLYPGLSTVTIQGFNCRLIGNDNLLVADMRLACPSDDKTSFVFIWSLFTTILYPIGIPLFMLWTLRRFGVHRLAETKINEALLREMLDVYQQQTSQTLKGVFFALALGVEAEAEAAAEACARADTAAHPDARALLPLPPAAPLRARADQVWRAIVGGSEVEGKSGGDGEGRVSKEGLARFLARAGFKGDWAEEIEGAFAVYDEGGKGFLDKEEFRALFEASAVQGVQTSGLTSGAELGEEELRRLCEHNWSGMLKEESSGGACFKKELKKKLLRKKLAEQRALGLTAAAAAQEAATSAANSSLNQDSTLKDASACKLPDEAGAAERLGWLVGMGRQLRARGVIGLPMVKWVDEPHQEQPPHQRAEAEASSEQQQQDSAVAVEQQVVERIGFLFEGYKAQFWYFELVEMVRKLLMTALIVFLLPASPSQLAGGLLITDVALLLFVHLKPFTDAEMNTAQTVSLMAQAVTLFYGLMIAINEEQDNGSDHSAVTVLIVLVNILVFAIPGYSLLVEGIGKDKIFSFVRGFLCMQSARKKTIAEGEAMRSRAGSTSSVDGAHAGHRGSKVHPARSPAPAPTGGRDSPSLAGWRPSHDGGRARDSDASGPANGGEGGAQLNAQSSSRSFRLAPLPPRCASAALQHDNPTPPPPATIPFATSIPGMLEP